MDERKGEKGEGRRGEGGDLPQAGLREAALAAARDPDRRASHTASAPGLLHSQVNG